MITVSTLSYASVQAALNAADGIVQLPPGTLTLSQSLVSNNPNVTLRGEGRGTIIRADNGANIVQMIELYGANSGVRDLVIDGNRANDGTMPGNNDTAGIAYYAPGCEFEQLEVRNVNMSGILGGQIAGQPAPGNISVSRVTLRFNGDRTAPWGTGYKTIGQSDGITLDRIYCQENYGLTVPAGQNYSGSGIAIDSTTVCLSNSTFLNNYNGGGQWTSGGMAGLARNWSASNVSFIIQAEPVNASTSGIEATGTIYAVNGCTFQGHRKGAAMVLQPGPGTVAGRASFCGNVVIDSETGINILNSGTGFVRTVTIDGNAFNGQSWCIAYVQSLAQNIRGAGNAYSSPLLASSAAPGEVSIS